MNLPGKKAIHEVFFFLFHNGNFLATCNFFFHLYLDIYNVFIITAAALKLHYLAKKLNSSFY